jgi:hypothetical protein
MRDAAKNVFRAFANALERKQASGEELCDATAFASKSAEQTIRIAGVTVMGLLEQCRRTLEASEFEKRLEALEAKK